MALHQYKGLTYGSSNYFLDLLKKLPTNELEKLGIKEILEDSTKQTISSTTAVRQIAKKLKNVPANQLKTIQVTVPRGGLFLKHFLPNKNIKINFIDELNKSRAFMANNAKTTASKFLQKGIMSVSEAAGGGVIGGFGGMIMNSIFVASALKKTWEAPWGEKLSTFMEAALVDFCGGYLMMLLGSRITYKLLGIKNADKSAQDLLNISKLSKQIAADKNKHEAIKNILKHIQQGNAITPEMLTAIKDLGINTNTVKTATEITKSLEILKQTSATNINKSIDKLKLMKSFKKQGFFKDLINRPLRWIGNFFSVGLETLPAKVAEAGKVSTLKAGIQKIKNILKGIAGYPVRFLLVTMIITPPLTKLVAKISHKLFGTPSNSEYNENKKDVSKAANKGMQKVDIDNFANYTKTTGLLKASAEEQLRQAGKLPSIKKENNPEKIHSELVDKILSEQKYKSNSPDNNDPSNQDISPSKYVPNTIPTDFSDPNLTKILNQKLNYSVRLEKHLKNEVAKIKANNLYDF